MTLRYAVLGLLSEGPASGYELVREFAPATSLVWPAPRGEIYRELARLQTDGLAAPSGEAGPRGRRAWRITAAGRAALRDWLRTPSDLSLRYEPMLKAVFLGALADADARAAVRRLQTDFQAELTRLRIAAAAPDSPHKQRRRFARPMVVGFYEAMLAWCEGALRELEPDAAKDGEPTSA